MMSWMKCSSSLVSRRGFSFDKRARPPERSFRNSQTKKVLDPSFGMKIVAATSHFPSTLEIGAQLPTTFLFPNSHCCTHPPSHTILSHLIPSLISQTSLHNRSDPKIGSTQQTGDFPISWHALTKCSTSCKPPGGLLQFRSTTPERSSAQHCGMLKKWGQTPDGPRGSTLVGGAARMVLLRASGRSICEKCMFAVISEKVVVSV